MSAATLNGVTVTAARVQIPAWGVWHADVECASSDVLTGSVALVLGDVTFRGTILSGGAVDARTRYRIAGGGGGWGERIAARAYENGVGVKASKVIADAATACGETVGTLPSASIGTTFVRAEGPASAVLNDLYPSGWYMDEAGVTQVGARTATTYKGGAPRTGNDAARGTIELAPESLATILPGVTVDGVTAVDVEHVLEGGKLRTTIWGAQTGRDGDPVASALGKIVDLRTAAHRYFAPYEYRVVLRHTDRYDLQCVRRSTGMPDLLSVRIKPGVSGMRAHAKLGSLVIVQFVNGDPARPVITGFDDYDSGGFIPDELAAVPTLVRLGTAAATDPVVRKSDLQAAVDTIRTWANAHVHVETGGSTNVPTVLLSAITATGSAVVKAG